MDERVDFRNPRQALLRDVHRAAAASPDVRSDLGGGREVAQGSVLRVHGESLASQARGGGAGISAAGYSACFHSALQLVARSAGADLGESSVGARVGIGPNEAGGFELAVELEVVIPNLLHDEAQALADKAHQVCPYSNATRGNIDVKVTVVED